MCLGKRRDAVTPRRAWAETTNSSHRVVCRGLVRSRCGVPSAPRPPAPSPYLGEFDTSVGNNRFAWSEIDKKTKGAPFPTLPRVPRTGQTRAGTRWRDKARGTPPLVN